MATKIISENTAVHDYTGVANTGILQNLPDNNISNDPNNAIGHPPDVAGVGQENKTLLIFSGIANIPGPVDVSATTLTLVKRTSFSTAGNVTISVCRLLKPWNSQQVTWNNRAPAVPWIVPGIVDPSDVLATPSATISVDNSTLIPFTITSAGMIADVQGWINGDFPNYGWLIRKSDGTISASKLTIRGNFSLATDGDRPSLSVTYEPRIATIRPIKATLALSGAFGKTTPKAKAISGANLGPMSGYYQNHPFINMSHYSNDAFQDVPGTGGLVTTWIDSNRWITGLPAGQGMSMLPLTAMYNINTASPNFIARTGTYYVTWTGPATVSFVANEKSGVNTVINSNRCSIVLNLGYTPSNQNQYLLTVRIQNNTGAPIDFNESNNLRIFHADDEADMLAGKLLQATWVNKIRGIKVLRMMDWARTNQNIDEELYDYSATPTDASTTTALILSAAPRQRAFDSNIINSYFVVLQGPNVGRIGLIKSIINTTSVTYEDEENPGNGFPVAITSACRVGIYGKGGFMRNPSSWPTENFRNWGRVPLTIMGKTGTELGADIWPNIPVAATPALVLHMAQQIKANYSSGRLYVEVGNECWNFGNAYIANRGFLKAYSVRKGTAVDTNGNPSTADDDLVYCAVAELSYTAWKIFESVFGRDRIIRVIGGWAAGPGANNGGFEFIDPGILEPGKKCKEIMDVWALAPYIAMNDTPYNGPTLSNVNIALRDKYYTQGYDKIASLYDNNIIQNMRWKKDYLAVKAIKCPDKDLISYECGLDSTDGGILGIQVTSDLVNNAFQITDGTYNLLDNFEDGDLVSFPVDYTSLVASPAVFSYNRLLIKRTVSNTRIQLFLNQANYDANIPVTLAAGTGLLYNYSRYSAWQQYKDSFRDSVESKNLTIRYYNAIFRDDYKLMCQYFDIGGANGNMWGMSRTQYEPNNPTLTWFKTLPTVSPS